MGSNNKRFGDDEERTMISDEIAAVPREGRERVFQRSLSEEDITKFLPNTNEVPAARVSNRVPGARASAPGARPSASAARSNVAKASVPGSQRTLSESPPLAPAPEPDEESTHIFQGSRGEEFHAAVASKRNTLLKGVPSFEDNDTDHGGDESTLVADAAAMLAPQHVNPPVAAKPVEAPSMLSTRPMEAPIAAGKPIPEARKSAPPPAFARRVEPTPPPVNAPVVTPEPLQSTHSGSLAVAVTSPGENTAEARSAKAEGKRSMVPWAAAFAAVLLLAVGGSVVTMRHRAAAAATASFVDPGAHAGEGSDPVRSVEVPVTPAVAADPAPAQVAVPGAMPEAVVNPAANPVPATPEPAQGAAQPAPQPQAVAQAAPQPQLAAQPAPQQPQVAVHAAPKAHAQSAPHPVAVAERPAPAEKPQTRTEASAIAKKKGALTEEEKRAADEAKRLADKQLEQSL